MYSDRLRRGLLEGSITYQEGPAEGCGMTVEQLAETEDD